MSNLKLAAQFYKGLDHQDNALDFAWNRLSEADRQEFLRLWRNSSSNQSTPPSRPSKILLSVPFVSQLDHFTQQHRTCNSASCFMFLRFFRPNISTTQNDYLREVLKRGDTTSHAVQTATLRHFGVDSFFSTTLTFEDLVRQLQQGRPVVISFLHRGTMQNPSGGHVVIARGVSEDRQTYFFNDPYGSLNDGYTGDVKNGQSVAYSREQLFHRWQLKGASNGWGRIYRGLL